jgi:ribosomal protein S18 acetylase RimI-like enzyme
MVEVRRCTAADVAAMQAAEVPGRRRHAEKFAAQERGWCDYLLAFDGGAQPVGHVVVRNHSKYGPVIGRLGAFPEVNGLAAYPTGRGTGTTLLRAAEDVARARGAASIGLAVERSNHDARRLYEAHGYVEWPHGDVIDDWDEFADDGTCIAHHHDVCAYLILDLP